MSPSAAASYQLFVGVDIAARSFTAAGGRADQPLARPVRYDQTPSGYTASADPGRPHHRSGAYSGGHGSHQYLMPRPTPWMPRCWLNLAPSSGRPAGRPRHLSRTATAPRLVR